MKGEAGDNAGPTSPSPRANTSRASFGQQRVTPQAITEGRRLYVGNMPYTAKAEDVEALFTAAEFPVYVLFCVLPDTSPDPLWTVAD